MFNCFQLCGGYKNTESKEKGIKFNGEHEYRVEFSVVSSSFSLRLCDKVGLAAH